MDQLSVCNLTAFELIARRVQLNLDAHSTGGQPQWEGSEHFLGLGKRAKGIAPMLQQHVAQKLKDEAEIQKQRGKAREVRKLKGKKDGKDGPGE